MAVRVHPPVLAGTGSKKEPKGEEWQLVPLQETVEMFLRPENRDTTPTCWVSS